jgi:outer membrane lipoprotein-sorting protein
MYRKGSKKRLIKFLSPADVKGVGFLVLSDNDMYLYMPAYRRIRRIASHIKNESFMGSDFSYDDIGTSEYTKHYNAKLIKETSDYYVLECRKKPSSDKEYTKLVMKVDKKTFLPLEVKFYKGGNVVKRSRMVGIRKVGKYYTPSKIIMEDLKTGHKTELILQTIKYDIGLRNSIFSKRYLKKRER